MDFALVLGAAVVGVVVGLTGMGGGALMTPMLVLGFNVPPLTAVSSDIVASAAMKPVGSFVHFRRGTVNWKLASLLMIGSVPTAALGVVIVKYGFDPDELTHVMKRLVGSVLLIASAGLILRAWVRLRERARVLSGNVPLPTSVARPDVKPRVVATIAIGAFGGLIVGLTSVGSGSLMIVALMALYPKLRAPQLVGTDLAQAVPLVVVAAISHILLGHVDWGIVGPVVLGSIPGAYVGARISSRVSGGVVRRALALVLMMAGLSMLGVSPLIVGASVVVALAAGTVAWGLLRHRYGFPAWRALPPQPLEKAPHSPQFRLSRTQTHELELALGGAYEGGAKYGPPADLATPTLFYDGPPHDGKIVLLDIESTPVAIVAVEAEAPEGAGAWITGPIQATRTISPGAFAESRLGTAKFKRVERATVVDGDQATGNFDARMPTVVLDGEDPARTSQRVQWASEHSKQVAVLPEPTFAGLDPDQRHQVLAALVGRLWAERVEVAEGVSAKGDGAVILFTGLSGAGKSTLARAVAEHLHVHDARQVTLLDGDEVRMMISKGLGFSREDRELNLQRIGWVAALVAQHGGVAICAPIAPYQSSRDDIRARAEAVGAFHLVHVSTPLEVCEQRDRKGLYAAARRGEIEQFTGISDPYEEPTDAALSLDLSSGPIDAAVAKVVKAIGLKPVARPARKRPKAT